MTPESHQFDQDPSIDGSNHHSSGMLKKVEHGLLHAADKLLPGLEDMVESPQKNSVTANEGTKEPPKKEDWHLYIDEDPSTRPPLV